MNSILQTFAKLTATGYSNVKYYISICRYYQCLNYGFWRRRYIDILLFDDVNFRGHNNIY